MIVAAATVWVLVLELTTGRQVALDVPTEAQCHAMLEGVVSGQINTVTVGDGKEYSIRRAVGCVLAPDIKKDT